MAKPRRLTLRTVKEFVMRYLPAALALSLMAAVTASIGQAAPHEANPRAVELVAQGKAQLAAGNTQQAVDSFEAALTVDPAYSDVYLQLAQAARDEGLQGKAIHYYQQALAREPNNLAAISGEGEALVAKGAVAKAQANLAKLKSMCGNGCDEAQQLAAAIAAGPKPKVLTAEAVSPEPKVTQN
jgi:tetratricopeptide (TPR) repeat protein